MSQLPIHPSRSIALGLATAVLVAGLGGVLGAPALAKKVNIKWWSPGPAPFKELVKEYQKAHPGVTITTVTGTMDKFYTMVTAGLMPDMWGPYDTPGIKADVNRDWATDLTPYIKRDGAAMDINDFFPGLMREFRVNGKQYALPFICWEDFFFYNTDMYAQAGLNPPPVDSSDKSWNWDRMVLNAKKISKADANGKLIIAGVEFERNLSASPAFLRMWNALPYTDAALRSSVPQQIDWTSPEMVNAFTKVHDLIYKHRVAPAVGTGLENGKLGQQFSAGWRIQYITQQKKVKWAMANLPWGETNAGTMWPDGWRMSKVSKNKEQVWDFIKFLCSKHALTTLVTAPSSAVAAVPMARKSVFAETLGASIAKMTGMRQADVVQVAAQADAVNGVKYQETICIHMDLALQYLEPIANNLWANKVSPVRATAELQDVTNKRLPALFQRWVRNVKFTGKEPVVAK